MAVYKEKDKKAYLKYNKKEKKAGRKPKTFTAWMAENRGTARTQGASKQLKNTGMSYKELSRLRDK